mgnify:CR=1 FL=1
MPRTRPGLTRTPYTQAATLKLSKHRQKYDKLTVSISCLGGYILKSIDCWVLINQRPNLILDYPASVEVWSKSQCALRLRVFGVRQNPPALPEWRHPWAALHTGPTPL